MLTVMTGAALVIAFIFGFCVGCIVTCFLMVKSVRGAQEQMHKAEAAMHKAQAEYREAKKLFRKEGLPANLLNNV